jgi:hypothetical protein
MATNAVMVALIFTFETLPTANPKHADSYRREQP